MTDGGIGNSGSYTRVSETFVFGKANFFGPDAGFRDFRHVRFWTCPWVAGSRDLGLNLETVTRYFRARAISGLYGCLRPSKMFSVGPILGFRPDFGPSEICGFWGTFWRSGLGWDGLGWLDLARFRVSGGCFRPKTGFSSFVGTFLGGRKLILRWVYFGFGDLWPRFWELDVLGVIGIGIPCFASTVFDNDNDRR